MSSWQHNMDARAHSPCAPRRAAAHVASTFGSIDGSGAIRTQADAALDSAPSAFEAASADFA
jgi:hypothetical protein